MWMPLGSDVSEAGSHERRDGPLALQAGLHEQ
jgi:hypothetical protein